MISHHKTKHNECTHILLDTLYITVAENNVILLSFSEPPGPPTAPEVEDIFRDSCMLSWRPPDSDGGTPITGYYVERSMARANRWIRITRNAVTETTFKADDLIEDNEYQFRIVAENKAGEGPPGPSSKPMTAKDPWGRGLTVTGKTYDDVMIWKHLLHYWHFVRGNQ